MKVILLSLGLFLVFYSNAEPRQNINDYIIFQSGEEQTVPVYQGVVTIKRDAFSIRFFNKKYNEKKNKSYDVRLAGFLKKHEWGKIESGLEIEKSSFFQDGSAYAITQEGNYNGFFFSDEDDYLGGSHHLVYGHPDIKTASLLKKEGEYFKLEFKIESLFLKGKLVRIADTSLSEFYIVFLNDINLDGIADEDELTKVVIKFKQ